MARRSAPMTTLLERPPRNQKLGVPEGTVAIVDWDFLIGCWYGQHVGIQQTTGLQENSTLFDREWITLVRLRWVTPGLPKRIEAAWNFP